MPVTRMRRPCRKPIEAFLPRRIVAMDGYRRGRSVSHNRPVSSEEKPRVRRAAMRLAASLLAAAMLAPACAAEKVFRYAFPVAETGFDPAQISDLYSSTVIENIFDSPLTYDFLARPVKLVPNTLESMPEIDENGTLYRMRVRPGIYFAD